jgi:16S rRNA (guanine(966)-N(2))-methyltransferase RsmD
MRIITGKKRGMKLNSPRTHISRPITDKVKESLFSVLSNYGMPQGKRVADIFCGIGSLGLEALSRGAEFVTFIEKDPKIITVLKNNIAKTGFVKESRVIKGNAFKTGAGVDFEGLKYGLIFVDPPYSTTKDTGENSLLGGLLLLLSEQLASDGLVAVRTDEHTELIERYGRLEVFRQRKWGTMTITFLSLI